MDQKVKELEAQVTQPAAENAALKSGQLFFMHSDATGFEIHKTREAAIASAEDMISDCREEAASEGWPEDTDTICWGIIMQKAVEGEFEKPSESNGFIGWSEYSLQPTIETPATDAFLSRLRNETRAEGVEMALKAMGLFTSDECGDSVYIAVKNLAAALREGKAGEVQS